MKAVSACRIIASIDAERFPKLLLSGWTEAHPGEPELVHPMRFAATSEVFKGWSAICKWAGVTLVVASLFGGLGIDSLLFYAVHLGLLLVVVGFWLHDIGNTDAMRGAIRVTESFRRELGGLLSGLNLSFTELEELKPDEFHQRAKAVLVDYVSGLLVLERECSEGNIPHDAAYDEEHKSYRKRIASLHGVFRDFGLGYETVAQAFDRVHSSR